MRQAISTSDSAAPRGPYSQAIIAEGRFLFVAGQLPLDPVTGELVEGDFEAQAAAALHNLKAVIESAGATMSDAVRTTVYLRDISNSSGLTEAYAAAFPAPYPARTTVQAILPLGAEIEIDAIVVLAS